MGKEQQAPIDSTEAYIRIENPTARAYMEEYERRSTPYRREYDYIFGPERERGPLPEGGVKVLGVNFKLKRIVGSGPLIEIEYDIRKYYLFDDDTGPVTCWRSTPLFSQTRPLLDPKGFNLLVGSINRQLKETNEPEEFRDLLVTWLCEQVFNHGTLLDAQNIAKARLSQGRLILPKLGEYLEEKGQHEEALRLYFLAPMHLPEAKRKILLDEMHDQAMSILEPQNEKEKIEALLHKARLFYKMSLLTDGTEQGPYFRSVTSRYFGEYIGLAGLTEALPQSGSIAPESLVAYFESLLPECKTKHVATDPMELAFDLVTQLREANLNKATREQFSFAKRESERNREAETNQAHCSR